MEDITKEVFDAMMKTIGGKDFTRIVFDNIGDETELIRFIKVTPASQRDNASQNTVAKLMIHNGTPYVKGT